MRMNVNDTELYFDVEGVSLFPDGPGLRERPTIIAIPGGPGFDHAYFKPWLTPLTDVAQVIYLDPRGTGLSGRPPIETCNIEQMAEDVAALSNLLGIDHPIILGHSAGGFVALHLVSRHPECVDGLILLDTGATSSDEDESLRLLERRAGLEARHVVERMWAGDLSPEVMAGFSRLVVPAYYGDPARFKAVVTSTPRPTFNSELSSFWMRDGRHRYDVRSKLPGIHVPTMVLVGEQDWITPPRASEQLAALIPQSELVVLPGVGHFAFSEEPEEFIRLITQFVTRVIPKVAR